MKDIDPKALFKLSVLGPLVSRERLERGELQQLIRELSSREYAVPDSKRRRLGEKTIEAWYYAWRRDGINGLQPKTRGDSGQSRISPPIQEAVLAAKRDNPRRSIRQIVRLLEAAGTVPRQSLSRSATHRLLLQHGLSQIAGSGHLPEEKRSFTAEFAGSIWYGDVMHGPRVPVKGQLRKTYLVSLIDDASRLVALGHEGAPSWPLRVLLGRDRARCRGRAQAGAAAPGRAHQAGGRQRRGLPSPYPAGCVCTTGHPPHLLPALRARGQGVCCIVHLICRIGWNLPLMLRTAPPSSPGVDA